MARVQADSHDAHGAPLGADEAEATRKQPGSRKKRVVPACSHKLGYPNTDANILGSVLFEPAKTYP